MPDLTTCQRLTTDLADLGVPLPDEARIASEFATALNEFAAETVDVAELREAVETGEVTVDTARDMLRSAALDLAARDHRHAIARDLLPAITRRYTRAVVADGDRIVRQLRKRWEPAAKSLRTHAGAFTPGEPAEQVLARGRDAATAWTSVSEAATTLDRIAAVRTSLAVQFGYGAVNGSLGQVVMFLSPQRLEDVDLAVSLWDKPKGPGGRWHRLLDGGFDLALPTGPETVALATEARAALAQRQQDASGFAGQYDPRRPYTLSTMR